jgi:hypothetical protein
MISDDLTFSYEVRPVALGSRVFKAFGRIGYAFSIDFSFIATESPFIPFE